VKQSNCHIRFNHLKIVAEQVLPGINVNIIYLTDKNIFTVSILQNPQNLLMIINMQSIFLPQCCQMFTDLKQFFTGRLDNEFVKIGY